MRKRTVARELALQALYEFDARGDAARGDFEGFLQGSAPDEEVAAFARELVLGVWDRREEIDRAIAEVARNWELPRMAVVDRNILRLGAYELLHRTDIPPLVAINEAIELAKKFSTKQSGAFVNGILDAIRGKRGGDGPGGLPLPPEAGA